MGAQGTKQRKPKKKGNKVRKDKPVKQKSSVKTLRREDMYDKDGKPIRKYDPYKGPVVNSNTYGLYKTPLERQNAQRREKAHKRGETMYKAKTWIPEHNGVPGHYVWVDKFVQQPAEQKPEEVTQKSDNSNDTVNTEGTGVETVAPAEVPGVQE